jgi:hypothetical protein
MEAFDFSKLSKPFSANDIGGKLPDIPDTITKAETVLWCCDSMCDWMVNNATRHENYYKPIMVINNSIFGASPNADVKPQDSTAFVASLGYGRPVRVRSSAVLDWYKNRQFMPEFVCGGYSGGYLDFVLREWVEVSSEQNRFQNALESDSGWKFFLQHFPSVEIPDLGDDDPIIMSSDKILETYIISELTKVGITPTPSILKYTYERLDGKNPNQCDTSPMLGAMITSFLVTDGISKEVIKNGVVQEGQKEFLAHVYQNVDISSNMFPPRLFSRIQETISEHRTWIKKNLNFLTPKQNCFLVNINLQEKMPGRPRGTAWDKWIDEHITSPETMPYLKLLSLCEESEFDLKQKGGILSDSRQTELTQKERKVVHDRLRKALKRRST